jgi:protein-tyrosine phosphatase
MIVGKSRSATIVISYLMSRHNMTATEAFNQVRRQRPEIDPNFGSFDTKEAHLFMNVAYFLFSLQALSTN